MIADAVELGLIVVLFAAWVTAHVAIVGGLFARRRPARAFGALVVPPLAPYWGARAGMRARASLWVALVALYVVARVVARYVA